MTLRSELHKRKLTQREVSEIAGVSVPTVCQWCAGLRSVPPVKARAIHERWDIPLHVLNPEVWPPKSEAA